MNFALAWRYGGGNCSRRHAVRRQLNQNWTPLATANGLYSLHPFERYEADAVGTPHSRSEHPLALDFLKAAVFWAADVGSWEQRRLLIANRRSRATSAPDRRQARGKPRKMASGNGQRGKRQRWCCRSWHCSQSLWWLPTGPKTRQTTTVAQIRWALDFAVNTKIFPTSRLPNRRAKRRHIWRATLHRSNQRKFWRTAGRPTPFAQTGSRKPTTDWLQLRPPKMQADARPYPSAAAGSDRTHRNWSLNVGYRIDKRNF